MKFVLQQVYQQPERKCYQYSYSSQNYKHYNSYHKQSKVIYQKKKKKKKKKKASHITFKCRPIDNWGSGGSVPNGFATAWLLVVDAGPEMKSDGGDEVDVLKGELNKGVAGTTL